MARGVQGPRVDVGVPLPPPDLRPYVPLITLPASRETAFLALHASVTGFLMHWLNNQHVPHNRERDWCDGCKLGQTPRWEGFLGVISLNTMNRFILRVPAGAFRYSGIFRERSDKGHLAGAVFTSYRFGRGRQKTNPAVIEMIDEAVPMPKSNPFPLFAALSRYWRMETLTGLDVVNRPEESQEKLAAEFVEYAKRVNAGRRNGKDQKR